MSSSLSSWFSWAPGGSRRPRSTPRARRKAPGWCPPTRTPWRWRDSSSPLCWCAESCPRTPRVRFPHSCTIKELSSKKLGTKTCRPFSRSFSFQWLVKKLWNELETLQMSCFQKVYKKILRNPWTYNFVWMAKSGKSNGDTFSPSYSGRTVPFNGDRWY